MREKTAIYRDLANIIAETFEHPEVDFEIKELLRKSDVSFRLVEEMTTPRGLESCETLAYRLRAVSASPAAEAFPETIGD